jgi:hypothetical protein
MLDCAIRISDEFAQDQDKTKLALAILEAAETEPYPWGSGEAENRDWYTDGINSAPGTAIETAMMLTLAAYRIHEQNLKDQPLTDFLTALLLRQTDPGEQPFIGARAVAARWLPWIDLVLPKVAPVVRDALWPAANFQAESERAAWGAYAKYTNPFPSMAPILGNVMLGLARHGDSWLRADSTVREHTAWHIVVHIVRNELEKSTSSEILAADAPALHQSMLDRIGRVFPEKSETKKEEFRQRAMVLADAIVARHRGKPSASAVMSAVPEVVQAVGYPEEWRLNLLRIAHEENAPLAADRDFIRSIASMAANNPTVGLPLLAQLISRWAADPAASAYWTLADSSAELRSALLNQAGTEGERSRLAEDVAQRLVSMGLLEFREVVTAIRKQMPPAKSKK